MAARESEKKWIKSTTTRRNKKKLYANDHNRFLFWIELRKKAENKTKQKQKKWISNEGKRVYFRLETETETEKE